MVTPLAGIRVIEVGQALAGPLAGVILAELGADVIKVEKPDGGDDARLWGPPFIDDTAVFFHVMNRDKRSVALDLKNPVDVERLKGLARTADILIQNLRPGIVDELGIGAADMLQVNPRLIYCNIGAFGNRGPHRFKPGYDPLLQAFGAVMTLTGRPDDPPTFQAPAINDKGTGMWAVIGVLAALQGRQRTGKGSVVDTSLFETALGWVENNISGYSVTKTLPARHGSASGTLTPYGAFETADRPIVIAAGNDRLFQRLAAELGHPAWASDPRYAKGPTRIKHRAEIEVKIQAILKTAGREEWLRRIEKIGVPVAPINDIAELMAEEQTQALGMLQELPGTPITIVGLPISFDGERVAPRHTAPAVGAHNDVIFADPRLK